MNHRVKRIGMHLCVIIGGILCAFILAEIYFRLFNPQLTAERADWFSFPCFEEGKHRWIKLVTNATCPLRSLTGDFPDTAVTTNSLGLRNREISPVKKEGSTRILFVGDSYTMGWGVDEDKAFPRLTETMLNSQSDVSKIETINAGFAAAGPSGYYLYLKLEGMALKPDVVVIGFYLGNDILSRRDVEWIKTDTDGLPDVVRSKTTYVDSSGNLRKNTLPIAYRIPFLKSSHVYIWFVNTILGQTVTSSQNNVSDKFVSALVCQYKEACKELDSEKQEVMKIFKGIKKLTDAAGAKLVVAIIPTDFQIHDDAWYKYRLPFPLLHRDRGYPDKQFTQWFTEAGITTIDLLPAFLEHKDEQTYFTRDDHWNARGHAIAAEAIAKALAPLLK